MIYQYKHIIQLIIVQPRVYLGIHWKLTKLMLNARANDITVDSNSEFELILRECEHRIG